MLKLKLVILLTLIKIKIFKIKSFLLALKMIYIPQKIIREFILHLIFLILTILLLFHGIKTSEGLSNLLFTLSGAVISIWITIIFNTLNEVSTKLRLLKTIYVLNAGQFQCLREVYLNFIDSFPFTDNLFRKDKDIIYISPIITTNFLDEKKLKEFLKYFKSLDQKVLMENFDKQKTRQLIHQINKDLQWLNNLHSSSLNFHELQDEKLFCLFDQFFNSLQAFIHYDKYKWEDGQILEGLIISLKILLSKMGATIITIQKILPKYEEYIKYVSNPPKLPIFEDIRKIGYKDIYKGFFEQEFNELNLT